MSFNTTSRQCVLNGCPNKQGSGTWCRVTGLDDAQPVCEEHWRALRISTGMICPDCDGLGWVMVPSRRDPNEPEQDQCARCGATGTVARS